VPEGEFEAALNESGKPSTNGILKKKREPIDVDALWLWGRLRAERKTGQLLQAMGLDKGRRPSENRSSSATSLADLGISRDQASFWQFMAGL